MPAQNRKGFTLIELLIVLVIAGIVVVVAVMAFGDFGASRRQHIAVEELKNTLNASKYRAILQPALLRLNFLKHGFEFQKFYIDPISSRSKWLPINDSMFSKPNLFKQATLKPSRRTIYITPDGLISQFHLAVDFDKKHYHISVNKAGEVTIED